MEASVFIALLSAESGCEPVHWDCGNGCWCVVAHQLGWEKTCQKMMRKKSVSVCEGWWSCLLGGRNLVNLLVNLSGK